VLDDFIRPYTRQSSYRIAGIPAEPAAELAGRLRVAADLRAEEGGIVAARALVADVHERIRGMAHRRELDPAGIAGHALLQGAITVDEAVLLTVPTLEMAVTDMSGALTHATLLALSTVDPSHQQASADERGCRSAVLQAARRLPDIYITRVAARPRLLADAWIHTGDRVLIDATTANSDLRVFPGGPEFDPTGGDAEHIAFGHGVHSCMGRELAVRTAAQALYALLRWGVLTRLAGRRPGMLRLVPHDGPPVVHG
jgi:cytochrome P450